MKRNILHLLLVPFLLFGCETIVDVKVNETEPYLVVDAWLTHTPEDQTIRLTTTQPYYEATFAEGITNAQVVVTDDAGNTFSFEGSGDGNYTWSSVDTFGVVGRTYFLEILWEGGAYTAVSRLNRVPSIDSITFSLEEGSSFGPAYYYSEFFGTDPEGEGDAYWLKAWRNGKHLNQPDEIYLFYDASFGEGNGDGIPFIYPIRTIANPFEQDINGKMLPPFWPLDTLYANEEGEFTINDSKARLETVKGDELTLELVVELERNKAVVGGIQKYAMDGNPYSVVNDTTIARKADSVYLELHSVSPDAWFFLNRLWSETNRPIGFGALFATPPANLPTNIVTEGDRKVAGFFNVASVSSGGRKLTEDALRVQPR